LIDEIDERKNALTILWYAVIRPRKIEKMFEGDFVVAAGRAS
jgi:hypothetical protein